MDSNHITQVILNLALNGIQAMDNGGELELSTMWDAAHVSLLVCDHGHGLSAQARARLFEPFFTTKPGGTGLGLAVAYQWVRRHGGSVQASDAPGGGTVFTVRLPRQAPEPSAAPATTAGGGEDGRAQA
jgi:signal transduction histidine kinase